MWWPISKNEGNAFREVSWCETSGFRLRPCLALDPTAETELKQAGGILKVPPGRVRYLGYGSVSLGIPGIREGGTMSRGRILVVDDEIYIVHILDFSLGMEGYKVVTALDGEEGLQKALEFKPDLIVLDIMMPKMDGYETCKALKSDEQTKNIPVILLSAKGRNVDMQTGYDVGADEYITKPFSPRKLVDRINAMLGQTDASKLPKLAS